MHLSQTQETRTQLRNKAQRKEPKQFSTELFGDDVTPGTATGNDVDDDLLALCSGNFVNYKTSSIDDGEEEANDSEEEAAEDNAASNDEDDEEHNEETGENYELSAYRKSPQFEASEDSYKNDEEGGTVKK